jgi:putative Holliday junction resolvase
VTESGPLGRVVAFDPGSARIGVAVCDASRTMAFPHDAVPAGPGAAERCATVARAEEATVVVVGLPVGLDGTEGPPARAARELAEALRTILETPDVVLHDERLTTVTATARLREAGIDARTGRARVDGAAAVVLLESWLAS